MKYQVIDLTSPEALKQFDAVCFTSNGVVKDNGELVMGAGVALAFKNRWQELPRLAGDLVKTNGNICQIIKRLEIKSYDTVAHRSKPYTPCIIAFPTKHHYSQKSCGDLIRTSAIQLMKLINENGWKQVGLPKPGCQNGGLVWEYVRGILQPILDDRVIIITR